MTLACELPVSRLADVQQLCEDAFDGAFSDDDWAHGRRPAPPVLLEGNTLDMTQRLICDERTGDDR